MCITSHVHTHIIGVTLHVRGHNNSLANIFKVSWLLFGKFSEIFQISLNSGCHGQYQTTPQLMNIVVRVRNKSTEKVPGPAGIQTQDTF